MKKFIQFTVSAIVVILLTANISTAQKKVKIQFDPVQNEAGIPGKTVQMLHKQIERSFMELNRIEVLSAEMPNDDGHIVRPRPKPLPKNHNKVKNTANTSMESSKPSGEFKADVIAKIIISSFEVIDNSKEVKSQEATGADGGPSPEFTFTAAGKIGILKGKVDFINVANGKIVETAKINGKSAQLTKGKAQFNKASMLKSAMDNAVNNFRDNVKYLFPGNLKVAKMLEVNNGQAFNVILNNGSNKDIRKGYTYSVIAETGNGEMTKSKLIAEIVILTVKENEAMAKVNEGKANIYKAMSKTKLGKKNPRLVLKLK